VATEATDAGADVAAQTQTAPAALTEEV